VSAVLGAWAPQADDAWLALHSTAPDKKGVDVLFLRALLSRAAPDAFLTPEVGFTGPILSTIHASKGREAERVRLFVSEPGSGNLAGTAAAEEARVLYVGATRARQTLRTCEAQPGHARYLTSGRATRRLWGRGLSRAFVELGREGDLDICSAVSISQCPDSSTVLKAQTFLASLSGSVRPLRAVHQGKETGYRYDLFDWTTGSPGLRVGALAARVNYELFDIAKLLWPASKLNPPPYIDYLYCLGARTVVLELGDQRLDDIHTPFAESGFWLVPLFVGLPTVPFFRSGSAS
jgi:hypothetical protein